MPDSQCLQLVARKNACLVNGWGRGIQRRRIVGSRDDSLYATAAPRFVRNSQSEVPARCVRIFAVVFFKISVAHSLLLVQRQRSVQLEFGRSRSRSRFNFCLLDLTSDFEILMLVSWRGAFFRIFCRIFDFLSFCGTVHRHHITPSSLCFVVPSAFFDGAAAVLSRIRVVVSVRRFPAFGSAIIVTGQFGFTRVRFVVLGLPADDVKSSILGNSRKLFSGRGWICIHQKPSNCL
ncbi:hypothetical protein ACFE04_011150 [Oxalis oulophora]